MSLNQCNKSERLRPLLLLSIFIFVGCIPEGITDFDFKALQPEGSTIPTAEWVEYRLNASAQNDQVIRVMGGIQWGANITQALPEDFINTYEASIEIIEGVHFFRDVDASTFFLLPEPSKWQEDTLNTGMLRFGLYDLALEKSIKDTLWMQPFESQNEQYALVWEKPIPSMVGEQALQYRLFRWGGQHYEVYPDAQMDIYPYMDMGGGDGHSTPFRKPEAIGNGRYSGTINYIMSGGWECTVDVAFNNSTKVSILFSPFYVYDL